MGSGSIESRLALLPPWWLLPLLIAAALAAVRIARLTSSQLLPLFSSVLAIVPWLPVPLPAAALLWTGPLLAGVWSAVILGLIVAGGRPVRSPWLLDPPRARLLAATLALALYGGSAWWLSPVLPTGDEPHYLIITQSLLNDGDLRIENNHQRGDYLAYSPDTARPHYRRRGLDGAIYSIHSPGLPVLIAPVFYLFGYPGAVALLGLVSAIGTALVWHLGHRITGSASAAWFGWGCCALTTPFFFLATQIFPDGIAATCVLLAMLPLIDPAVHHRSKLAWFVSGLSLALLPWLQTRFAVLAVAAGMCLAFRMRKVGQLAIFAAPAVVSAALWFGYFYAIYGTANPSAPYGNDTQMGVANLTGGFPGLLFDQQFGLIPNAPVYGFVLVGVIAAAARMDRWSWEVLIVVVPYLIGVGMFQIWFGGTSAPARYMTPLAMLLGVAAARIWHNARTPATKSVGLAALGASVLVTMALAGPDRGRLLLNFRDGVALWLEWGNDLVDLPRGVPSLFRDAPAHAWLKAAIWGISFAAAWFTVRTIAGRVAGESSEVERRSIHSAATSGCLATAVMIAFSLAWRVDNIQPLTPETGQIGLLGHLSAFRSVAYDYRERRFKRAAVALAQARLRTSGRRPISRSAPLLSLSNVPAGSYRVHLAASEEANGTLLMRVGATPLSIWTWKLSGTRSGPVGTPLRFPVEVQSLLIEGDERARRTLTAVELEPVIQTPPADDELPALSFGRAIASRAVRYDSAETYFMDEQAFVEPGGFWVTGGQEASIVIANHAGPLGLFLRNVPVDNTVAIDVDGERHEIALRPREETMVVLPRTTRSRDVLLRIQTSHGIRPSQIDSASGDMRYLGCWVELR